MTTRSKICLFLILALAIALRWYSIGKSSIWIDEAGSITLAQMPWGRFLRTLWQYEANMAFYYLLLRGWLHLGTGEAMIRSFSALVGVLAVPAIYLLGRRMFSETTGLLAAALLAVNMFHVWFSQDARGYPLAVLLVILSLAFFAEAVEGGGGRRAWIAYALVSVLAVYAHFFAALTLAAEWVALGPRRLRSIGFPRMASILLAIAAALLPIGAFILFRDQGQVDWVPPTNLATILWTSMAVCGFSPLTLLLVLLGIGLALWTLRRDDADSWGLRLLAVAWALPLLIIGVVSHFKPLFFFRYFAICIPPATLLAARVLTPVRTLPKLARAGVAVVAFLALAMSLGATAGYYKRLRNWGGDWRSAIEYVLAGRKPGDAIVFQVSAGLDDYRYYVSRAASQASGGPLPEVLFPGPDELASAHLVPKEAALVQASEGHPRLWLVLHQKEATDLPPRLLAPYVLVEEKDFTASVPQLKLKVALYARKTPS